MNRTAIEYLDFTWNPVHGCSPESTGCKHCWAERSARRLASMRMAGYDPGDPFGVTFRPGRLEEPMKIKKPSRVGVCFMGDLFHPKVKVDVIRQVFKVMFDSPHTFFVLTKRPARMLLALKWLFVPPVLEQAPNIWYGTTVENQTEAAHRIKALLNIPAANRWISAEPLLSPLDIRPYLGNRSGIKWVVCGCESGPGARPMSPAWAASLAGQCQDAGIPFMLKQMMQGNRRVSLPELNGRQYAELPDINLPQATA